jgi:hypothetical protein
MAEEKKGSIKERLQELVNAVNNTSFWKDVEDFEGGLNSTGSRIRKELQRVKQGFQQIRLEVQSIKNARVAERKASKK